MTWQLSPPPPDLAQHYVERGLWNDDVLGTFVARELGRGAETRFRIWSRSRARIDRLAGIDRDARRLAACLRARGIGAGDAVAFQLPNWREAAVSFYAIAYTGAVLVPIVHFYGPREV
ncbi:MAG: AMP-binding protein, partial [Vicinamibacterales bacterium]|nr:AMP-binding protein [Vicinamibacterales bacterium]